MKVNVEVQAAAESLREAHSSICRLLAATKESATRAFQVYGETVRVTLSVGAATLYRSTGSDELLDAAQAALQRAKAARRDRVCA